MLTPFDQMALASIGGDSTMRMFFAHQGLSAGGSGGFSISALRVKAAALYERGAHLGASWGHCKPPRLLSPATC